MTLKLYFHPLSSYSWKTLIALYENGAPFDPVVVDQSTGAEFKRIWPIGKFPLLIDAAANQIIPESSIIIEYLDLHYPGPTRFLPADPDLARQTRMRDRFYDNYLQTPMQKIVSDRIRPLGEEDVYGVDLAFQQIQTAMAMVEQDMAAKTWAMGEDFSLADCAAAPALFYADKVAPFAESFPNAAAYLQRLMARPSFTRTLEEAQPYFALFPKPRL